MNNIGWTVSFLAILLLLLTNLCPAEEVTGKERMPLWDRIALSEVKIYTTEGLDQQNPPQTAKKGAWAHFIRHSQKFTTELVELESGGQFWIQEHSMLPLYYVVGTDNLMVQLPGTGTPPNTMRLVRPGDTVAVDHASHAPKGKVLVWSLDGSLSGLAPLYQLEPVGDSDMGLAGD